MIGMTITSAGAISQVEISSDYLVWDIDKNLTFKVLFSENYSRVRNIGRHQSIFFNSAHTKNYFVKNSMTTFK